MSLTVSPNQDDIQTVLRAFLIDVLPAGVEVIEYQDNQVPEPSAPNFVIMSTIRRPRLATNVDSAVDTLFTASIAATVMTVTELFYGEIVDGAQVFGAGVTNPTTVVDQVSGTPGGEGIYTVSASQTVAARSMAAGRITFEQDTEVVVQLDVHSDLVSTAADMAQTISTMFRDDYAVQFFADREPGVSPLYAEDPQQRPFLNAENQYETRWVVEVMLQANQVVSGIPQQFAAALTVSVVSVDAAYPPS